MKAASPALIALLDKAHAFLAADLYSFALVGGQVLRFSGLDADIAAGGLTYADGALRFKRSRLKQPKGLQVSALEVEIFADTNAFVGATPFLPFAAAGGLDGAIVTVERLMLPAFAYDMGDMGDAGGTAPAVLDLGAASAAAYGFDVEVPLTGVAALGLVTIFSGRVADCEIGRTAAKLTIKSWPELLNVMMPRNLFQAPCLHTLFDPGCGLAKSAFAIPGCAALAGATQTAIPSSVPSGPDGYFALGEIVFTSGANNGLARTVKSFGNPGISGQPSVFTLAYPLPQAPAAGDSFIAYPGCDKSQATCQTKFANLDNFRGFPYVPNMETSI